MTDDRLQRAFRELDAPVVPDGGFADRLFEDLVVDLGLGRGGVVSGGVGGRLRRLWLGSMPSGHAARRLAYVAALAGLLLALLGGALFVAASCGPVRRRSSWCDSRRRPRGSSRGPVHRSVRRGRGFGRIGWSRDLALDGAGRARRLVRPVRPRPGGHV